MPYTYDEIFAKDTGNPEIIAQDATITIFDPADPTKAPVPIFDVTGLPLPNPITVSKEGMGPAFYSETLDRVGWFGAGFQNYLTSYEGMRAEAQAAKTAAQNSATAASAAASNASSAAAAALAEAVADAEAAAAAAATSAGLVGAPADTAVETLINTPASATATALAATITTEVAAPISAAVAPKLGTTDVANSALLASGKKVVLCGDSITDGAGSTNASTDSYRAYLGKIIGSARVKIVEHGVPGERSDQLLARVPAIIAENPAAAVIMIGTNDAGQSVSMATFKTNFTAILDLFLAARIPVIVNLVPPRGSAASSPSELTRTYNLWLRHIAAVRGLPLVDVFAALVDQATGLMQTAYDADGTHPTPAGHLQIAKAVAPVLQTVISTPLPWVVAPGAPGLIANPLMAGGGVSTPPTSWTSTGVTGGGTGTVGTVAADGVLKAGSWMKITADATAVGSTVTVGRYSAISPAPAPGDVILVAASVKQDVGSETAATVQFSDGTTTIANPILSAGVAEPGKILVAYTIPVGGYVNPRIRCITSAAAGTAKTAYFGEVQVWNLTALGITELAA